MKAYSLVIFINFAPQFKKDEGDESCARLQSHAAQRKGGTVQPKVLPGLEPATSTNSSCWTVNQSRNTLFQASHSQVSLSKPSQQHQA